jgi:bifunctional non-homologous end joining protein LigD
MSLATYKKKRDLKVTPEPKAGVKKSEGKLIFVVQRHKASQLHYDFRLEMDGVLKSWAVPKGPSLNPQDKRLAMMVEDHPYDYKDFKGVIPEGHYGAGIVEIWDKGTYTNLENDDKATAEKKLKAGLKAGNLKFTLKGKKLKGEFALVRLKGKQENAWLLIKHNDAGAIHAAYNSEAETPENSPINKWLREQQPAARKKKAHSIYLPGPAKKLNDYIRPMLAKEADKPFDDKDWIFEIKWDGYRAIAEVSKKNLRLYSRQGNSFLQAYPLVAEALKNIKHEAVIDGEIVVLTKEGNPSFQLLQHIGEDPGHPMQYYVFDLLSLKGHDTTELSLLERKELLWRIIPKNEVIKYSDHIAEKGKDFFRVSTQQHLEGIIAKKANSKYYPGVRSPDWLKIKNHHSQEVIIVGYTEPGGARKYFGALVLALKRNGRLVYAGHTGSGFTAQTLKEIWELLQPLVTDQSPFKEKVKTNMPVTWVTPELVGEVKFTEWTREGRMRHPIFLRLRADKPVKEVNMTTVQKAPAKKAAKKGVAKAPAKKAGKSNMQELVFGKTRVKLTNLTKVFWPEEGYTKGDVIEYYQQVADYILPYLKDRPQSLLRNPNGITGPGFFHKDAGDDAPAWVKSVPVYSESNNKDIDYIICNDKATLAYLNNLGCIELNPWNSTVKALDKPGYMIVDIDPGDKNTFNQVIEVANVVKEVLDKAGAESYCKTSGASGLHVFVPMGKKYTYEQVKNFCHLVCSLVQEQLPGFTTLERNLKKRGNKHIYIDYLQNRRGQTISSVYSVRPKPGATVSTPLHWKEVKAGLTPAQFTIKTIYQRLKKQGDLFAGVLGKGIDLHKCLVNLEQ